MTQSDVCTGVNGKASEVRSKDRVVERKKEMDMKLKWGSKRDLEPPPPQREGHQQGPWWSPG